MYKQKKIAVIIPAYNESKFIKNVLSSIPEYIDDIIVVDDCSNDTTSDVAQEIHDTRIVVIRNEHNCGVGGSTLNGFKKADERGNDIFVKVDGDGQMPLAYVSRLLDAIIVEQYAYAKGNRFIGHSLTTMPFIRLMGNIVLTFLNKLASGYWHIFDPQSGFVAIDAEYFRLLNHRRIHHRYFFENDMLVQLNIHNARVKDIPIPALYGEEKSDVRLVSVLCTFPILFMKRCIYRIYQKYILRDFSPIALFLFTGCMLMFFGCIFGTYHWIKSDLTHFYASTGTVMIAVLPIIVGFQLILQALVLDIANTPR